MARSYYEILGLSKDASKDDVKKKYKLLAKKYHPDISKEPDAEERFKEISEAYAILSDDQKRAKYDQFGHSAFSDKFSQEDIFQGVDFESILEGIFGGRGSSIFNTFGSGRNQSRSRRGSDLRYDLEIDFEEAVFGCEKKITFDKLDICGTCSGSGSKDGKIDSCSYCKGSGMVNRVSQSIFGMMVRSVPCKDCSGLGEAVENKCGKCDGVGRTVQKKKLGVNVPKGTDNGLRLRLRGEGEAGFRNAGQGDLLINMHVRPHAYFGREGDDILLELPVSFVDLSLGTKVKVDTIHGGVTLKVPAGTQPNTVFKIRGKGAPKLHGFGNGHQFVRIKAEVPTKLTKKAQKLLNGLRGEL